MNHELKVSAQQVICQGCWQYQLVLSGCQWHRQVRGRASHNHGSPFLYQGLETVPSLQVVVFLPPEKQRDGAKKRSKLTEGQEEQSAHTVIHDLHIFSASEFKLGQGWRPRTAQEPWSVCVLSFVVKPYDQQK